MLKRRSHNPLILHLLTQRSYLSISHEIYPLLPTRAVLVSVNLWLVGMNGFSFLEKKWFSHSKLHPPFLQEMPLQQQSCSRYLLLHSLICTLNPLLLLMFVITLNLAILKQKIIYIYIWDCNNLHPVMQPLHPAGDSVCRFYRCPNFFFFCPHNGISNILTIQLEYPIHIY